MLPRRYRLKKSKDIQKTLKFGRKIETPQIKISVLENVLENTPSKFNTLILQNYDSSGRFLDENIPKSNGPTLNKNSFAKLTVIISAKMGKAHDRNKFKRRVRNLMRQFIQTNKNTWVVISSRKLAKDIDYSLLQKDLQLIAKN